MNDGIVPRLASSMRGFKLREEVSSREAPSSSSLLEDLTRTFRDLDASLVRDVFHQAQSCEEAVTILSSIMPGEEDDAGHGPTSHPRDHPQDESGDESCHEHDGILSMWEDVLPMDCKRLIWSMLSGKEMARAAATSREWHEYALEMLSLRTFLTVQRSLQPDALEGLVKSHEQAEKIKIDYRKASLASVSDAGVFYRTIRRGQEARFSQLEGHKASGGSGGSDGSWETWETKSEVHGEVRGSSEPSVRIETFQQPKDIRIVLVNSSEACRFDNYELESLLGTLGYVENLSIVDSPSIDDNAVRLLLGYRAESRRDGDHDQSRGRPGSLHCLSLIHTRLSNRGFKELMLNLSSSELDVSRNRRVTELIAPPARSHLRFLTAKSLPNLTKINLSLSGTRLRKLDLGENHALTECVIIASNASQSADVRQFHELNLSGCKNLRMLMLDCPDLKTLTCARCRRLQLVGGFIHGLNVPALETLNVNACREATDEGLNLLLGKVRVRHLNVGGCVRLTRLKIAFREGAGGSLDAYGCGRLGLIEIRGSAGVSKVVTSGCRSGISVVRHP